MVEWVYKKGAEGKDMIANEDTVKKMRDRHVGEEKVSHYQTHKIHLFSSCRAAAAVKRGTSGWKQRTISSKCSRGWGG